MIVTEELQQRQTTGHDTSAPVGSIGWLRSSADEGNCKGTTRRARLRHPLHAGTRVDGVTNSANEDEVSWSLEADTSLNQHLSLLQIKSRGIMDPHPTSVLSSFRPVVSTWGSCELSLIVDVGLFRP